MRTVLALAALSTVSSRAEGQGTYYRSIPIGERAIGLGGSFTGISNDPSAAYYNPGGLVTGGRFELLGSLSSFVFDRDKLENAIELQGATRDAKSTNTTTLPHFVGTVLKFGEKTFGDHRYALAFSSLEVARDRFSTGFSEIESGGSADFSLSRSYKNRWWGLSFAMQATENVSVGISGFLANQRLSYDEDLGIALGGTLQDNGVRIDGQSVTSTTRIGVSSWSFVFRLGALYRINPKWKIGFMFQPPYAPLKETGKVFRRIDADIETGSSFFLFDESGFDVSSPIPFELRVGIEYKIDALTTLAADVALTGPVRDRQIFDLPQELEITAGTGAYFSNSTKRRVTPNASIGVEHLFGKAVVAGGLFTNISAAPNVPETTEEFTPAQVSTFGASVSVGIDTRGYRLTLGAAGSFGRGDALSFTIDPDAGIANYRRTKANSSALLLYIAGAISVASKGAKQVQEKYKERKSRKNDEGT